MTSKTYYEILRVEKDATNEEINNIWKALAKTYHPDNLSSGDSEKFKKIKEAYDVLSDSRKRSEYDRTLKTSNPHITHETTNDLIKTNAQNNDFRTGETWTSKEDILLQKHFAQGLNIAQISSILNRAKEAIFFRLMKLGLLGFTEQHIPLNHGKFWSQKEDAVLLKEFSENKTIEIIARIHGRQKNSILYRLVKLKKIDFNNIEHLIQNN